METQTTIFEYISPTFKIDKHVRLIEMFAGIGSQAKALENLGVDFEHWKVIEFDQHAVDSYNAVHGTQFQTSDIRNVHAADLEMVERERELYILTYSFPCQDLSLAGNRKGMQKGSGTRSGLLWEVERILDECEGELPQVLLMENVPQVIGKKNIADFQLWRDKLEKLGYSNYVQILNSKDYGIPQNRERCFMVSILGDWNYLFPVKQTLKIRLKDLLEENVDKKYYVSKEKIEAFQRQAKKDHKPTFLDPSYTHTQLAQDTSKTDCGNNASGIRVIGSVRPERRIQQRERVIHPSGNTPTLTATEYKDPIKVFIPEKTKRGGSLASVGDGVYINRPHQKRGTVQKGMIPTLKTSPSDIGVVMTNEEEVTVHDFRYDEGFRNRVEQVCPTLTAHMGGHGESMSGQPLVAKTGTIRKLTPRECWRLMGFTDEDFEKAQEVNSDTQLYKQAGNSIVVNVLMAIFKQML